jgi:hypothetical protein
MHSPLLGEMPIPSAREGVKKTTKFTLSAIATLFINILILKVFMTFGSLTMERPS